MAQTIQDVMTPDPTTPPATTTLADAARAMRDGGRAVGIVSPGDLARGARPRPGAGRHQRRPGQLVMGRSMVILPDPPVPEPGRPGAPIPDPAPGPVPPAPDPPMPPPRIPEPLVPRPDPPSGPHPGVPLIPAPDRPTPVVVPSEPEAEPELVPA